MVSIEAGQFMRVLCAPLCLSRRPQGPTAIAAGATHLLTGDVKRFGAHMNRPEATAGLIIQTVADFLGAGGDG